MHLPTFPEPPPLLRELLVSSSSDAKHFRKHIRSYNSALAMASVRADFVSRGAGESAYNPTITVHGRMYHEMGTLSPPSGLKPRFASVYIHDTEHATRNRKHFYGQLRESILSRIAVVLRETNELVKSFMSLCGLIMERKIPESVQLVVHAHSKSFQVMRECITFQKLQKWQL